MTKKRINKILWYGSDLKDGEAKAPSVASLGNNGLDGINDGELYICNADEDPAIFTKTNKGRAVRVGGGTGNGYTKEEIDTFLGKKLDKSVWDSVFKIHYGEDGSVRWIETLFDLVVDGGITMYGIGDHTASTIMDGILVDGTTIGIVDGKLSVIGDIGGGTANGIRVNGSLYSPDEDGVITIPNYPTSLAWNDITGKPGWIGSTKPSYSWDEINRKPSVFPTDWENVSGKPSWIGTNKPSYDFSEISNKPTTLAGYGITDAYTKDGISKLLDGYVTLNGAQDITGVKSFVNGVNIGDILVKKHSDRVVELDGDLIVTGSITIFAQGSHTASTILDALPIDETTLSKEGNKLSVIGGVGGGSVDGIILNGKTYSPDAETKLITLPDYPTSMDWGSITNTPSTLAGYGITDAYTKAESNANYVIKSGDTMTGDLNVRGQLHAGNEQFVATLLYTFIGKEKGIYFSNDANNDLLYVNTHYNRVHKSGSFTINEGTGVVNFQNDPLVEGHNVLHLGNYSGVLDNRYVNKSGDTMTGDLLFSAGKGIASSTGVMEVGRYSGTIYLQGNSLYYSPVNGTNFPILHTGNYTGELDNRYVLKSGDTMRGTLFLGNGIGQVGADDTYGSWLQYGVNYINVKDNGLWRNNSYKIWDEGNDGSGSGLDADFLDGYHEVEFVRRWFTQNPGYDCNTHNDRPFINFTYGNNAPFTGGFIDITTGSYGFYLGTGYASDTPLYYRRHGTPSDGGMGAWQQLARITDNIASATKLQTPRTIWGQSFDGTSNISGLLSGATTIECSVGVRSRNICIETESDGTAGIRGSEINCFTSAMYLQHATTNNLVMCNGGGNVVIGMVVPDYRLHVNGDIGANGSIYSVSNGITSTFGAQNSSYCHISTNAPAFWFSSELRINGSILPYNGNHWIGTADSPWGYVFSNGWFRSLGNTGWYSQTYDGGIYMTDSTYVRVYNKNWFRSNAFSAGTDGYQDDAYSVAYNACAPSDKNYCCYSFVRYGVRPFGIGFNTDNEIWLGTPNTNRTANEQWLKIGGVGMEYVGNFLTHGSITMYYSSDKNLKANIRPVTNASERLMSIGGVYDFEYIDSEVERNSIYAGTHTGLIYQNVKGGVMDCMAYEREDGKGALNYIDPSFISLLAAVEIEHEGRIQVLESENKMLKANNEELMNRINELERRIA